MGKLVEKHSFNWCIQLILNAYFYDISKTADIFFTICWGLMKNTFKSLSKLKKKEQCYSAAEVQYS